MASIEIDAPGTSQLLMGNEAIARGALEAGIGFATGYPGNPSTELLTNLIKVANEMGIYAEWSVNEKVAMEMAASASWAGIRAIVSMKNNGVNVATDFLSGLTISGINAGLVLVVVDDPAALSNCEEDTRFLARYLDVPLLEPSGSQEAKDMTKYAFDLAEELGTICMVRSVNRISHGRANVELGELPRRKQKAHFDDIAKSTPGKFTIIPTVPKHAILHQKLAIAQERFEQSIFNRYVGPDEAELVIITCGSGWPFSTEAVKLLNLETRVGILKLGTTHPLPEKLINELLAKSKKILVLEEVDPFLERGIAELVAALSPSSLHPFFYGKRSAHINMYGGLNPDTVIKAIADIVDINYQTRPVEYNKEAEVASKEYLINRGFAFCPGCPHRGSWWVIKNVLKLDGRDGFAVGDVGCYTMAIGATGFFQERTLQCMGCGIGTANGFAKLEKFEFKQPVIAACGDGTFFHAAIPALINAVHNQSNFTYVIFDNGTTGMTGFQTHPGSEVTATGEAATAVSIEALCHSLGLQVDICDPFDLEGASTTLLEAIADAQGKPRVIIMRRKCALLPEVRAKSSYRLYVNSDKCLGEACGCNGYCTRVFHCAGLVWDEKSNKARIDEIVCTGCGLCADICPQQAITREKV